VAASGVKTSGTELARLREVPVPWKLRGAAVEVVQILGGRYDAVVSRNYRTRPTVLTAASNTRGAARDARTHSLIRSMKLVRIVPAR